MSGWIENEQVERALKERSVQEIEQADVKFFISDDFSYCVLVRRHSAWEVGDGGWRDANQPPKEGESWRWVLNFYHYSREQEQSSWFKIFVPLKYEVLGMEAAGDSYSIITVNGAITGKFSSHSSLMWSLMTGNAETEAEIERKFLLVAQP